MSILKRSSLLDFNYWLELNPHKLLVLGSFLFFWLRRVCQDFPGFCLKIVQLRLMVRVVMFSPCSYHFTILRSIHQHNSSNSIIHDRSCRLDKYSLNKLLKINSLNFILLKCDIFHSWNNENNGFFWKVYLRQINLKVL